MKNRLEGFTTGRILALLLVAAMILTLGLTAAASADEGEDEEIAVIEIAEPAEEETEDFEEIAVLDEETLIKAAEEAKLAAEEEARRAAEEARLAAEEEARKAAETSQIDQALEYESTYLYGPVADEIVEAAAAEIAAMSEEQRMEVAEIWNNNHLVYNNPEEMLSVYLIDGVSPQAAFVLILANTDAHVAYINNGFSGADRRYLEKYDESYARICMALSALGVTDLSDEDVRALLLTEIAEAYAGMRWAEENEEAGTGASTMFDVANTYWDGQSEQDIAEFYKLCEEIVG